MSDLDLARDPEELLRNTTWLRALARSLVVDPNVADDLLQQTWLTALEKPPRAVLALPAWLNRVLRNRVHRQGREEAQRRRHELEILRSQCPGLLAALGQQTRHRPRHRQCHHRVERPRVRDEVPLVRVE